MEVFSIATLETTLGVLRVSGLWNPLTGKVQLQEIFELGMDGWSDTSFWLTEQSFEPEVSVIQVAVREYLISQQN